MIEPAPHVTDSQLQAYFLKPIPELDSLINRIHDEYSYWSEVKYKRPLPLGVSPKELWGYVKLRRWQSDVVAWRAYGIHFSLTAYMQRVCQEMDMDFGGLGKLDYTPEPNEQELFLINSLMDEAIASSQMEGASTTRKVAREMLLHKRKPRDKAQKMILNNYSTIQFIVRHQDVRFTPELLLELHALMTEGTLEKPEDVGRLRQATDDVVVEHSLTREIVHTPPMASQLPLFVEELCDFFNDEDRDPPYIHPIVRGIIIHFMIGYMHPFVDGNGRTARALFYWYMMKRGYSLMQYLSVSRIIQGSKSAYEQAYLFAEHDGLDIGYFITYHLRVLTLAFRQLREHIARKRCQRSSAQMYQKFPGVNERQAELILLYTEDPSLMLTAKDVQGRFLIAPATAQADLDGLLGLGLIQAIALNKIKRGYVRSSSFDSLVQS